MLQYKPYRPVDKWIFLIGLGPLIGWTVTYSMSHILCHIPYVKMSFLYFPQKENEHLYPGEKVIAVQKPFQRQQKSYDDLTYTINITLRYIFNFNFNNTFQPNWRISTWRMNSQLIPQFNINQVKTGTG